MLDADDLAHPDRLRIQRKAPQSNERAALVRSGQVLIAEAAHVVAWPDPDAETFSSVNRSLPIYNPLSHCSVMAVVPAPYIRLAGCLRLQWGRSMISTGAAGLRSFFLCCARID